ncbi:hypothetical protein C5167_043542 [Papaver somniferum]|uniref:Uncharacterized protein n=1 Tax=Papaver somniferum TaxID=3469 RepID=A0A4Y7L9J3_PAPSO|nr:hypothetical protein C5167_043542 [Papaver somniferum]
MFPIYFSSSSFLLFSKLRFTPKSQLRFPQTRNHEDEGETRSIKPLTLSNEKPRRRWRKLKINQAINSTEPLRVSLVDLESDIPWVEGRLIADYQIGNMRLIADYQDGQRRALESGGPWKSIIFLPIFHLQHIIDDPIPGAANLGVNVKKDHS